MGRVSTQAEVPAPRPAIGLRWFGFAVAALLAQTIVIHVLARLGTSSTPYLLLAAHLVLVPFLVRNFSFWGMRLIALGFALNFAVMAANGGLMPVDGRAIETIGRHEVRDLTAGKQIPGTKNVFANGDEAHLTVLSDSIVVPLPKPFGKAISIGDVFIGIGILMVASALARRQYSKGRI